MTRFAGVHVCRGGWSDETWNIRRKNLHGAIDEHVRRSPGPGDLRRVPCLQDLSRILPASEMPQLSPHVLRGLYRESRDGRVGVQKVHRLPRVHLPAVPQEDSAVGRRRQETSRQLPRRQSGRNCCSSTPAKVLRTILGLPTQLHHVSKRGQFTSPKGHRVRI